MDSFNCLPSPSRRLTFRPATLRPANESDGAEGRAVDKKIRLVRRDVAEFAAILLRVSARKVRTRSVPKFAAGVSRRAIKRARLSVPAAPEAAISP